MNNKRKTSDLTGAALDWAVSRALGPDHNRDFLIRGGIVYATKAAYDLKFPFAPSTNWSQGGPIIEREKLTLMYDSDWKYDPTDPEDNGERWMADNGDLYYNPNQYGATPLVAAMRFYVASKLGDEVEIPDELR